MSFRARLALVAAAAVALAVLTASFVIYFVVRDQLRSTMDDSLKTTAGQIQSSPPHDFNHFGVTAGEPGEASIYPQVVDANGTRFRVLTFPYLFKSPDYPSGVTGAVQAARSLNEVDHSLGRIKNLL